MIYIVQNGKLNWIRVENAWLKSVLEGRSRNPRIGYPFASLLQVATAMMGSLVSQAEITSLSKGNVTYSNHYLISRCLLCLVFTLKCQVVNIAIVSQNDIIDI